MTVWPVLKKEVDGFLIFLTVFDGKIGRDGKFARQVIVTSWILYWVAPCRRAAVGSTSCLLFNQLRVHLRKLLSAR
jgi:hypothetical protein